MTSNLFGWKDFNSPQRGHRGGRQAENLIGRSFGLWTVVSRAPNRRNHKDPQWVCFCQGLDGKCGRKATVGTSSLKSSRSTGCRNCADLLRRDIPYAALYHQAQRGAQRRGLEFPLTLEEFTALVTQNTQCHYCAVPLKWSQHGNSSAYQLDRKDDWIKAIGHVSP